MIVLQEKAQLTIRKRANFFMDGRQAAKGSYLDSDGNVVSMSVINWSAEAFPDDESEKCLAGGFDELAFFDKGCGKKFPAIKVVCIV